MIARGRAILSCIIKGMKFFIASPWRNKEAVKNLGTELVAAGFEVYSFLENGANLLTGESVTDEIQNFREALENWTVDPNIKQIYQAELEGLLGCDAVVLLQPAGHSSLIEAGIGFGHGKRVIIVGEVQKPEVFYLIADRIYPTVDAFLTDLRIQSQK